MIFIATNPRQGIIDAVAGPFRTWPPAGFGTDRHQVFRFGARNLTFSYHPYRWHDVRGMDTSLVARLF